ncbi:MAG: hypothetical protein EOL87_18075 [Spartobacteria bacterium]|nr:hypothetical protein [Spartobacteria bacterium]
MIGTHPWSASATVLRRRRPVMCRQRVYSRGDGGFADLSIYREPPPIVVVSLLQSGAASWVHSNVAASLLAGVHQPFSTALRMSPHSRGFYLTFQSLELPE